MVAQRKAARKATPVVRGRSFIIVGDFNQDLLCKIYRWLDQGRASDLVTFIVNSGGGYADVGSSLYDLLTPWRRAGRLRTIATGTAASAAAMFVATGSPGQRFITPHAFLGMHECGVETDSDPAVYEQQMGLLIRQNAMDYEILAEVTGASTATWRRRLHARSMVWYDAAEAKALRLVDEVLE